MTDERVRQDLAAIEQLRNRDMQAVRSGELDILHTLVCDDIVAMPPGADFQRGAATHRAGIETWKEAYEGFADVEYELDFEELHVRDDIAVEWGVIRGATTRLDGTVDREQHKIMRVLRRGDDGQWRVWRAIWNDLPLSDARSPEEPAGARD